MTDTCEVRLLRTLIAVTALVGASVAACGHAAPAPHAGIDKIQHIVMVMQENRSFDSYFGTYPGANGIPKNGDRFAVCQPNPIGPCMPPYHDRLDANQGGPHDMHAAQVSIDGGSMDGFVRSYLQVHTQCHDVNAPNCRNAGPVDVTGYHDGSDLPNYWRYAHDFVLQDRMFAPSASWSLPEHLFAVSEWAARCTRPGDPSSCVNDDEQNALRNVPKAGTAPTLPGLDFAWTDLTYLLHRQHVSWGYYVVKGTEPDCRDDGAVECAAAKQASGTPGIWNPLPNFDTVRADGELGNIQDAKNFYTAARRGTLPAVSWVIPSGTFSEHPPASISAGQSYVTSLINAVMQGPDWNSTAIFVSWDDWGGFDDHVVPPVVDRNGYGIRVPGLLISPYAKRGFIDGQTLSFDAYAKFIEDRFLGGARLDPATDGRPDPRPDVREDSAALGDLYNEFDFTQQPRAPEILPINPPTDLLTANGQPADRQPHPLLPDGSPS